jgi:hypothetical protein
MNEWLPTPSSDSNPISVVTVTVRMLLPSWTTSYLSPRAKCSIFGPFLKLRNVARWKFDRTEKTYCHRTDKFLCVVGNRAIERYGIEVNHKPIPVVTAREPDAIWLRLSEVQTRPPRDDAKEQNRQAHK